MAAEYPPDRPKFYAHKLVRLMVRTCAAQEIGSDGAWLVTIIAHTEDAGHYRKAVSFWNSQLQSVSGLETWDRLDRARKKAVKAGWLHYEPGGKGKVGLYWVTEPPHAEGLPDGAVDEDDPNILRALTEESGPSSAPVRNQTGMKPDSNLGEAWDKPDSNLIQTWEKPGTNPEHSTLPLIPTPAPVPDPSPVPSSAAQNNTVTSVREVNDHYRTYHPKALAVLKSTSKGYQRIAARLGDGFSVRALKLAIDGNHRDPWCCGENKSGRQYHSLDLIFRDDSHVQTYIDVPETQPVATENERRSARAASQWCEEMAERDARRPEGVDHARS